MNEAVTDEERTYLKKLEQELAAQILKRMQEGATFVKVKKPCDTESATKTP